MSEIKYSDVFDKEAFCEFVKQLDELAYFKMQNRMIGDKFRTIGISLCEFNNRESLPIQLNKYKHEQYIYSILDMLEKGKLVIKE